MKENKNKYWKSIEEHSDPTSFKKAAQNELENISNLIEQTTDDKTINIYLDKESTRYKIYYKGIYI